MLAEFTRTKDDFAARKQVERKTGKHERKRLTASAKRANESVNTTTTKKKNRNSSDSQIRK